jgi:hypothetical protein
LKNERERERESIEKKDEGKRKAPRVSTNKMGKSIFREEKKPSQLQNLFT